MQIGLAVEHKDEKYTHDVSFSSAQTLNVTRNPLSAMNMFQNATISGGNITFNLVQQQWSMTINNYSSVRYYIWQLRSAILLALEMMNEWTPTFFQIFLRRNCSIEYMLENTQ